MYTLINHVENIHNRYASDKIYICMYVMIIIYQVLCMISFNSIHLYDEISCPVPTTLRGGFKSLAFPNFLQNKDLHVYLKYSLVKLKVNSDHLNRGKYSLLSVLIMFIKTWHKSWSNRFYGNFSLLNFIANFLKKLRFFFKDFFRSIFRSCTKFHIDFVKPSQFSKNKSKTSFELHLVLPNKFLKGHENVKLSSLADAAQIMPVWLGCLAGRFYGLKSRISKKNIRNPWSILFYPVRSRWKHFQFYLKAIGRAVIKNIHHFHPPSTFKTI